MNTLFCLIILSGSDKLLEKTTKVVSCGYTYEQCRYESDIQNDVYLNDPFLCVVDNKNGKVCNYH